MKIKIGCISSKNICDKILDFMFHNIIQKGNFKLIWYQIFNNYNEAEDINVKNYKGMQYKFRVVFVRTILSPTPCPPSLGILACTGCSDKLEPCTGCLVKNEPIFHIVPPTTQKIYQSQVKYYIYI